MNSGAISWKTKLQTVSAASTTDAEVYAVTAAIKEVAYLRDAMRRIGYAMRQTLMAASLTMPVLTTYGSASLNADEVDCF
jgi:hypothetical protein